MNMECSDINIDMPVNCTTKCPSGATDITGSNLMGFDLTTDPVLDEEPVYEEESSTGVLFTCSTKCMGHVVGSVAFSTVCVIAKESVLTPGLLHGTSKISRH
jgi:hypothetical protein